MWALAEGSGWNQCVVESGVSTCAQGKKKRVYSKCRNVQYGVQADQYQGRQCGKEANFGIGT